MTNFNTITTIFLIGLILVAGLLTILGLLFLDIAISSYAPSFSGIKSITMLFSGIVGIAAFIRILKNKMDSVFLVKLFCFLCVICLPYILPIKANELYYLAILLLLIMPIVNFVYFQANPGDIEDILPEVERKSTLTDKLLVVATVILGLLSLMIYWYSSTYVPYYGY